MAPASATLVGVVHPEPKTFNRQSYIVPGSERPGQTAVHRQGVWGEKKFPRGVLKAEVLPDIFQSGLSRGVHRRFLGKRPVVDGKLGPDFVWLTYGQVDKSRKLVGSALENFFANRRRAGIKTGEYETVGLWSANRPEWQIVDIACQSYRKVSVALYDTLGPDTCEYVVNHAEVPIVFAASTKLTALLALAPKLTTLRAVVSMDPLAPETKAILGAWGKEQGVDVYDWAEWQALGEANFTEPLPPTPDRVATICYTSGTTNVPKGVLLTHGNLTGVTVGNLHGITYQEDAGELSYLPLAHIYERMVELVVTALGGHIGFYSGDPLKLLEDAQILKPYMFPSVPRVLNRIYMAAMQAAKAPGLKGALFRKAMDVKLQQLTTTGATTHRLWDALVFRKVQAVLGGNVGSITSGSAPINGDCLNFLKIAFPSAVVAEGYGLTETCASSALCWGGDAASTGSIGPPLLQNECKLVDVPEMNYLSTDKPWPRGELCIRGRNVFIGYHKDEEKTKEAIDEEGWFHTGDIAHVDDCGRFAIIDRIKNIMKLSQGEYVALEKIENVYAACPLITQLYVHGDSLKDHLVGVLVPDPIALAELVHDKLGMKLNPNDVSAVERTTKDPKVVELLLKEITEVARHAGLHGFEIVKAIHVTTEQFTVENNLLTPTFKVRRRDAAVRFKDQLDQLYEAKL